MKPDDIIHVMAINAHQDDFEFNAGGLFAKLRNRLGASVRMRILATTRGASGHHELSLEETFRRREAEARRSAELLDAEYACLQGLDGQHLPGQVWIDRNTLGGLWNAIRDFEPDYIFCPPVITDPLAGIHIDHQHTAMAVRAVAYQVGVPHAYPTVGTSVKRRVRVPLIINVDDPYAFSEKRPFHVAVDISAVYERKEEMALCHASQIFEWLPFTDGRDSAVSEEEWRKLFRQRHINVNQRYGRETETPREFFRFTTWGRRVEQNDLDHLFPGEEICLPS